MLYILLLLTSRDLNVKWVIIILATIGQGSSGYIEEIGSWRIIEMFFNYNPIIIPGLLARNHPEVISTPLGSILPLSLVTSTSHNLGLIVARQHARMKNSKLVHIHVTVGDSLFPRNDNPRPFVCLLD